jgi:hypothetical protein
MSAVTAVTDRNTEVTVLMTAYEGQAPWSPTTTTSWLRRAIHV